MKASEILEQYRLLKNLWTLKITSAELHYSVLNSRPQGLLTPGKYLQSVPNRLSREVKSWVDN